MAQKAATGSAGTVTADSVRCLLLPLGTELLLVPNTAVAEVAEYAVPTAMPSAPGWLLGMASWRGRTIPVLDYAKLLGDSAGQASGQNARLIVFNTLNANHDIPFLACVGSGIPRLLEVSAEQLEALDNEEKPSAILCRVRLGEEEALVPDLDVLEHMLQHLGVKVG